MRKVSKQQREKNKLKAEETRRMHDWFREIWDEREDEEGNCYCYETGRVLPGKYYRSNTCCYDHVLEKSSYPQYKFIKKNIIIVHPDIHNLKGSDVDRVPRIKAYRDKLLELHSENKLED